MAGRHRFAFDFLRQHNREGRCPVNAGSGGRTGASTGLSIRRLIRAPPKAMAQIRPSSASTPSARAAYAETSTISRNDIDPFACWLCLNAVFRRCRIIGCVDRRPARQAGAAFVVRPCRDECWLPRDLAIWIAVVPMPLAPPRIAGFLRAQGPCASGIHCARR